MHQLGSLQVRDERACQDTVDAEFEKAASEQPRIEARHRDAIRRAKNIEKHGCARGVSRSALKRKADVIDSPVTVDAKALNANVHAVMCPSASDASDASVEKALEWEGC